MSDPTANQPDDQAQAPAPVEPPPTEVASMDVLDAEAGAPEDDGTPKVPTITVRSRDFKVRTAIPATLMGRFASLARHGEKLNKRLPDASNGPVTIENPTPQQAEALKGMMDLQGKQYDAMMALIHDDDREEFADYVDLIDPPIEAPEISKIVEEALVAITGRPTVPS